MAVFDKAHEYSGPASMTADRADSGSGTLHHFAFVLDKEAFAEERDRLEGMGIDLQSGEHPSFGWRSLYLFDPDGNSVELVCYDADLFDAVLNQRVQPAGRGKNMVRIIYTWKVRPARQDEFKAAWTQATTEIRGADVGARGSMLLQSREDDTELVTIARWDSMEHWQKFWDSPLKNAMQAMHGISEIVSVAVFEELGDFTI